MINLYTSNSWWIFDEVRMLYRRIPRDMNPDAFVLSTDWEPYSDLEIDTDKSAFTLFLNADKTRIMRGYLDDQTIEENLEAEIVSRKA